MVGILSEPKSGNPLPKYRYWCEWELFTATRRRTTRECNAGRDYDRAMAHFEILAGNGIRWQMSLYNGAQHVLHELRAAGSECGFDEDYLRLLAGYGLGLTYPPCLEDLSREQLIRILTAVKRYIDHRLRCKQTANAEPEQP